MTITSPAIGDTITDGTVVWTIRTEAFIAEGYINDLNINLTNGTIRQNICKYTPETANRPSFVDAAISYGNVITIGLKDNGFSQLAIGQLPVNSPPIAVRNFDKCWGKWIQQEAIVAKSLGRNGYIKYTNGLIVQWGHTAINVANIEVEIVFPISFTSFEYVENVLPLTAGGYNNYIIPVCTYKLLNKMLVEFSAVPSQQADWLAIGY